MGRLFALSAILLGAGPLWGQTAGQTLWQADEATARLVPPELPAPMDKLVEVTLNGFLRKACGKAIPIAHKAEGHGLFILVGNEENNPVIRELAADGLQIDRAGLGDEGFRIVSRKAGDRKLIIITANTPVGLKHGCQELVFFRTNLTSKAAKVDWPLDVTMQPAFGYRGVYMLPCWSAQDSIENWRAVLKFHSELTINRNWFWLGGFPLLEKYGGEYQGTALADVGNVRGLVELCRGEGMKFYIGDGWFTWHHAKAAAGSTERGIQYFLDLLDLLPGVEGIYLEPVGEGRDADEEVWRRDAARMKALAEAAWKKNPALEFAIAIGRFNQPEYRRLIHEIDSSRLYWWWCWGDPLAQNALSEHPLVLRWHTTIRMSDFHGSRSPPRPEETVLAGITTSYDPGQGYGNPWNGWAKMGHDKPRNVHPYTMPFFCHQYEYREHCWQPDLSEERFVERLDRRLFDADMPADAGAYYRQLSDMCWDPPKADLKLLAKIDTFVARHANQGTARNRDTLARMREAVDGIRKQAAGES